MTGRFLGAKALEKFGQNLRDGAESVSFFSNQQLKSSGIDPAVLSDPNYVKARAVIEDEELLDVSLF